ncbi:unnamed protein product [Colias eurytheme]|nr:unnamed protein product [Colias eurytheme]
MGSDDVFESTLTLAQDSSNNNTEPLQKPRCVGISSDEWAVWSSVLPVAWLDDTGGWCPACGGELAGRGARGEGGEPAGVVALAECRHAIHLRCLQAHLQKIRDTEGVTYIECLVCGHQYGRGAQRGEPTRGEGEEWNNAEPLPGHPAHVGSIVVTYNFQSGVQGAGHPAPGAPYYAVGFPRHSLLPDTPLGRQVLAGLQGAWERRLLFTVSASRTTGREHVVSWRVPPPPASPQHYLPPHRPQRALLAALQRLHALLEP